MAIYLKKFENHTQYETYTASTEFITPNVSLCAQENEVHYNPYVEPIETRLVAKYNVTSTSNPTRIGYSTSGFSAIEIDGVVQPSVVSAYTFSTTGEHTVKYTLTDPTIIEHTLTNSCNTTWYIYTCKTTTRKERISANISNTVWYRYTCKTRTAIERIRANTCYTTTYFCTSHCTIWRCMRFCCTSCQFCTAIASCAIRCTVIVCGVELTIKNWCWWCSTAIH